MVLLLAAAAAATACGDGDRGGERREPQPVAPSGQGVWAVGDGGVTGPEDERVAEMIERRGARRLLYLGDVYETGSALEFQTRYHPAFGRFKAITLPVPGNHDWTRHREGYDRYWAARMRAAGGRHYYSVDFAGWHLVALNTEEPIGPGSRQLAWLRRDLARRRGDCTIALSHSPRYSAGHHGDDPTLAAAWGALRGRAVALVSGHDHNYQRLGSEGGVTQFVVGTGGRARYDVDERDPRLAAADDASFGALRLELRRGRADYAYVTTTGRQPDAGSLSCSPSG